MKTTIFLRINSQLWRIRMLFCILSLILICLCAKAQKMNYALKDVSSNEPFHDGLAIFIGENHYRGAIDTNGKVAIRPQFKNLSNFANGTAIAETETGKGIVNKKGFFILEPKYEISNNNSDHPDVYKVSERGDSGKEGLFYNGRLVLPIECSYIYDAYFPFVEYTVEGVKKIINTLTGELFDGINQYGNIICCKKDISSSPFHINYYFTKDGEPIDKQKHSISNKGIVPFKDQESNMYGFKNASTGQILIKPQYYLLLDDIWIDGFMKAPRTIGNGYDLISSGGKILLSGADLYRTNGKYIEGEDMTNGIWHLYDLNGKQVTELRSSFTVNMGHPNWFRLENEGKELIYDAGHNKSYFVKRAYYQDGTIQYDVDEGRFYVNAETGVQIAGPLKYGHGFHEGLAVVQRVNQEYNEVIDRNGKVYYREDESLRFKFEFSEGVLAIEERESPFIKSYIYNPLGHRGYHYNQTSIANQTIVRWNQLGHEAFDNKQYSTAKDYFYKVMMNDPTDVSAIINYGAALGNMGYYDEAIESCRIALDIDPDNQLAKDNLRINIDNKQKEEERLQAKEEEEREARATKSSTFWDALGNFANILSSVAGGTSVYQPYSSFSIDMDYSPSSPTTGSNHDYQSDYNRWANLAERHYNSLTNLGYRVKHNDGGRSGGTLSSMSGSKYVQMKKSLRDAQREMQRIRRKASQNGVAITPSTWETATVGY